ncbi:MAG: adenosylcobalamin-dependent ribonucleoside-diphosphate reductase [Patescibacteria group bacterium]|jgi:ribonucleoside-diphosphate reductase alpha chain
MPTNQEQPTELFKDDIVTAPSSVEQLYQIGKDIPKAPADLPEPSLSDNAWYIGKTRYAVRDEQGNPQESARDMFWRVAYNVATAERQFGENPEKSHLDTARKYYTMMACQQFMPNTPTMLNAGKPEQQLSACFVLPIEDNLTSILKTATDMAKIHKSGGGTGFSFSRLRPKGTVIKSSKGHSTGPISFMQMYNDIASSVRQGGVRRGANMGILNYNHPDILLFSIYKVDEFSLTNFNISVTVTEQFFNQVKIDAEGLPATYEKDIDYDQIIEEARTAHQTRDIDLKTVLLDKVVERLREWCNESRPGYGYDLVNPHDKTIAGHLNAKKVFDLITRLAWNYGDPGMIFLDRINESRANPTPKLGQIEATNPCGEQPLLPYDACTLGSINVAKYVNGKDFDWDGMREAIHTATRFLDDVLDMNEYPIDEVRKMTRSIRRIGLGIMGFADALLLLGVGYNTDEGLKVGEKLMKFMQKEADNASVLLAKERGPFPLYPDSIYNKKGEIKPRNGARTTIAPTGTISMLADCSSGCEPLFALAYAKNTIEGKRIFQTSPHFLQALKDHGLHNDDILEKIQSNNGSIQALEQIPAELKKVFVVAGDIAPEWHLKMQAALQKYTDNAISKTINFSNSATVADVRTAYWMAYETNCKGITIYRDGSREKQILETKKENSYYDKMAGKTSASVIDLADSQPITLRPRPHVLTGRTYKVNTPVGKAFISINEDENQNIFEVFINVGHAGSDITADAEAIGRLISLTFRIPTHYTSERIAQNVVEQLTGIGGAGSTGFGAMRIRSLADAVSKVLKEHESDKQGIEVMPEKTETVQMDQPERKGNADICPDCGMATFRFIEGCQKCENCGFSKC